MTVERSEDELSPQKSTLTAKEKAAVERFQAALTEMFPYLSQNERYEALFLLTDEIKGTISPKDQQRLDELNQKNDRAE